MGTRTKFSFVLVGGGTRDRTADLLHAMQALSQLSYTPRSKEGRIVEMRQRLVKCFFVFLCLFVVVSRQQAFEYQFAWEKCNNSID